MAPRRLAAARAASSSGCATWCPAPAGAWSTTRGAPKVAYHHLRRALAPVAVWTTDEGLGGVDVARGQRPRRAASRAPAGRPVPRLRAAGRRRPSELVERAAPTAASRRNVEEPARPLRRRGLGLPLRPAGPGSGGRHARARGRGGSSRRPSASRRVARPRPEPARAALGLGGRAARDRRTGALSSRSAAAASRTGCSVKADGFEPDDDHFSVEPGGERTVVAASARPRRRVRRRRADRAQPRRPGSRRRARERGMSEPPGSRGVYVAGAGGSTTLRRLPRTGGRRPAAGTECCSARPFGWEDFCSFRSRRRWAQDLAGRGHPALRIDLPATGDSPGSPRDPEQLSAWTDGVVGVRRLAARGGGLPARHGDRHRPRRPRRV